MKAERVQAMDGSMGDDDGSTALQCTSEQQQGNVQAGRQAGRQLTVHIFIYSSVYCNGLFSSDGGTVVEALASDFADADVRASVPFINTCHHDQLALSVRLTLYSV